MTPRLKVLGTEVQVKARQRRMIPAKDIPAAATELVHLLRTEARIL